MATQHLVKIKLDGDLRIMEISAPPRFDDLVKATVKAYTIMEPQGLIFTYTDDDGDQVSNEGTYGAVKEEVEVG